MHDDHATTEDRAGARIREALPSPDDTAIERIAARIADGEAERARSSRRRLAGRPRRTLLRPTLAAGAVAVAAGIALLAPGDDDAPGARGLLALGPDVAAADVLRAAGEQATDAPWRPLAAGEYHYVRSTYESLDEQAVRISERWTSMDGTTVSRESIDGTRVVDGDSFWMPASRCIAAPIGGAPPQLPSLSDVTLPAGSEPPACWQRGLTDPLLRAATGRVVDEPPVGAAIYLPTFISGPLDEPTTPRYGSTIRETDEPRVAPDAGAPTSGIQLGVPATFPSTIPVATTWIEIEPEVVVAFEGTSVPGPLASEVPVVLASWPHAFTMEQLAELPTDGDAMVDELRAAADRLSIGQPASAQGRTSDEERQLRSDAGLTLATELLATAPISPAVRQATFEALAELRAERQPATVLRDVELADGREAIGIRFELVQPVGYEHPDHEDDHVVLLLDAETAQPARQEMVLGSSRAVIEWDAPRRVTSID